MLSTFLGTFLTILALQQCAVEAAPGNKKDDSLYYGKRPLHIAQVAPLGERIPPMVYGGIERIVYYLVEGLVQRGHRVTLFASSDSTGTSAQELVSDPTWPSLFRNREEWAKNTAQENIWQMAQVSRRSDEFDVIHFHNNYDHLPIVQRMRTPFVDTAHGHLTWRDLPALFKAFGDAPFVTISDAQRDPLKNTQARPNFVATIYNGIPRDLYQFNAEPGKAIGEEPYLAFLGRIHREKGTDKAIQIALRSGIKLKIAAKLESEDDPYWLEVVKPLIDANPDRVQYIGEINDEKKNTFLGNAVALLFPIDWPEPFGMVMTEAMACGTPTIANPVGSVPEVVKPGVTGFFFTNVDDAVEKVRQIHTIDRAGVRAYFEEHFTAEKMVDNYLKVYEQLIEEADQKHGPKPTHPLA